jgi:hypothetical protein
VRRLLGQSQRQVELATEQLEALAARLASTTDHRELARLGEELAAAQSVLSAAEEVWLGHAADAEALGLDT